MFALADLPAAAISPAGSIAAAQEVADPHAAKVAIGMPGR